MQTSTIRLMIFFLLNFALVFLVHETRCSPPEDPVMCSSGNSNNCTVNNAYGAFPDRATCRAAMVVYPSSEEELIKAVAMATQNKTKMKVATKYSHSTPKFACPGGEEGLIISTRNLNRVLNVNSTSMTMTVESGVVLKDFITAAADAGMALPNTPYWWGLTMGGMLGMGAHGSSLVGKGSAVHDYVVALRVVTPASGNEGFARVRSLAVGDPGFDACRVSLGGLGAISQMTFKLEPMFKRSITYIERNDFELAIRVVDFGKKYEFADIYWFPRHKKAFYRADFRVPSNTIGDGRIDYLDSRSMPAVTNVASRLAEEVLEATNNAEGKCNDSQIIISTLSTNGFGLTNNGILFTGYPVIGFHNKVQASGSCLDSNEDNLTTTCAWDPRVRGAFYMQSTFTIALSKVRDFIHDVQKLRDMRPNALCVLEMYGGILIRYVKGSTAYLGEQEDGVNFDITYYRSHDPKIPRLYEDFLEEIEQMGLFKYGGLPHWGKDRNLAYDGVAKKYPKIVEFLKVRKDFDPYGLFSSEWSDQVLGIQGKRTSVVREGCALEGLCVCSEDSHCAPAKGYFCRPGKVYTDARVCSKVNVI